MYFNPHNNTLSIIGPFSRLESGRSEMLASNLLSRGMIAEILIQVCPILRLLLTSWVQKGVNLRMELCSQLAVLHTQLQHKEIIPGPLPWVDAIEEHSLL